MENSRTYSVAVDSSALDFQAAGPLFQRYSVALVGRLDRRWIDCYLKLTGERPPLARFRIDPGSSTVSFTCRATDGPEEVTGVLGRLEDMIALINESATAALAAEIEKAAKAPAPATANGKAAPKGDSGKNKIASVAEGLLARFSRRSG